MKDENSVSIVLEKIKENGNSNCNCEQQIQSSNKESATSKSNNVINHINNDKGKL